MQSLPTPQPQPTDSPYGLSLLNLFKEYHTPAAYKAEFGVDPPQFDASKPIKLWKDDTQGNALASYTVLDTVLESSTGVRRLVLPPTFVEMPLPGPQAAQVNIWGGAQTFPARVIAPTPAWITGDAGDISPVNPMYLSSLAEAEALNTALAGGGVLSYVMGAGPDNFHVDYRGDTRQLYYFIDSNDQMQMVGFLLAAQSVNGVGSPGAWTLNAGQPPMWVWSPAKAPSGPAGNESVMPMPLRQLYSASNTPPFGGSFERFTEPLVGQPMIELVQPAARK